ncbi:hypothetical protein Hanom_Chr11g01018791 [Helianthus anomalus]
MGKINKTEKTTTMYNHIKIQHLKSNPNIHIWSVIFRTEKNHIQTQPIQTVSMFKTIKNNRKYSPQKSGNMSI